MNQGKISTPLSVHRGSQQPLSVPQSPAGTEGASLHSLKHSRGGRSPPQRGWALGTSGSSARLSLAPQEMRGPSTDSQRSQRCVRSRRGQLAAARGLCLPPMPPGPPWPRPGTSAQDGPEHPPEPDTSLSRRKRGHRLCNYSFVFLIRQIKREGKREN